MTTVNQPQRPETSFRAGGVKATVWSNQTKDGNTYFSVSLSRSYKDGDEWKETNTYYRDDLPKIEMVSRKAFEFIHMEAEKQQATQKPVVGKHTGKVEAEKEKENKIAKS
ncbi:MAG: hypothetical protein P1V20_29720 [Verrucomicrobiales bacterium]|nr:hypothetical protein [Verrucomicrobiales bacterium]